MTVTINVTQDDIDAANYARKYDEHRGPCAYCPIAQAVVRVIDAEFIHVTGSRIWLDGTKVEIVLPITANAFAALWDEGKAVSPFSFELDIPAEYVAA